MGGCQIFGNSVERVWVPQPYLPMQKIVDDKSDEMARFFIGWSIFFVFVIVLCSKIWKFPEQPEQKSEKMCKNVL